MAVTVLTVLLYIVLATAGFVLVIAVCAIFLGLLHVILPAPRDPDDLSREDIDTPADT